MGKLVPPIATDPTEEDLESLESLRQLLERRRTTAKIWKRRKAWRQPTEWIIHGKWLLRRDGSMVLLSRQFWTEGRIEKSTLTEWHGDGHYKVTESRTKCHRCATGWTPEIMHDFTYYTCNGGHHPWHFDCLNESLRDQELRRIPDMLMEAGFQCSDTAVGPASITNKARRPEYWPEVSTTTQFGPIVARRPAYTPSFGEWRDDFLQVDLRRTPRELWEWELGPGQKNEGIAIRDQKGLVKLVDAMCRKFLTKVMES